jgi:hypothetical protein
MAAAATDVEMPDAAEVAAEVGSINRLLFVPFQPHSSPHTPPRSRRARLLALRSRNGTLLPCGRGIFVLIRYVYEEIRSYLDSTTNLITAVRHLP